MCEFTVVCFAVIKEGVSLLQTEDLSKSLVTLAVPSLEGSDVTHDCIIPGLFAAASCVCAVY